jgi:hypothetical protein
MNKTIIWSGRVITTIPVLFLLFDGTIKLLRISPVLQSFAHLGYNPQVAVGIGILELICVALYLIPRTSIPGAVLLTGYLGGAVATHLRIGDPLLTHVLFPTYVAALLWGGLLLRDARLRALIFLKPSHA